MNPLLLCGAVACAATAYLGVLPPVEFDKPYPQDLHHPRQLQRGTEAVQHPQRPARTKLRSQGQTDARKLLDHPRPERESHRGRFTDGNREARRRTKRPSSWVGPRITPARSRSLQIAKFRRENNKCMVSRERC